MNCANFPCMLPIVFTLLLSTVSQSTYANDYKALCHALTEGLKLYGGAETKQHPLDRQTIEDLQIYETISPLFMPYLFTGFGRMRLAYLLENPSLDRDEILIRQEAVKALIPPSKHQPIASALKKIEKGSLSFEDAPNIHGLNLFEHTDQVRGASQDALVAGVIATSMPVVAVLAGVTLQALGYEQFGIVADLAGFGALGMFGVQRLPLNREVDSAPKQLGDIRRAMIEVSDQLVSSDSVRLREIGLVFKELTDPSMPGNSARKFKYATYPRSVPVRLLLLFSGMSHLRSGISERAFYKNIDRISAGLSALADLEVIYAQAMVLRDQPAHYQFPKVLDPQTGLRFSVSGAHHPYLLKKDELGSVPRDLQMGASESASFRSGDSFQLLTGPNGRGKSTFTTMIPNLLILGMIGSAVPAQMEFTPMPIYTNVNAEADIRQGLSRFQAQAKRVSEILELVNAHGNRGLLIADEILNGTDATQGHALERALIEHMLSLPGMMTVLASHDRDLQHIPGISNIQVLQDFRVAPGASKDYNAIDEAIQMGMPKAITDRAAEIYKDLTNKKADGQ